MNRNGTAALLLALGLAASACSAGQTGSLERQTNSEGPVSVSVTPHSLEPGVSRWDFDVALNTHSVNLDVDLTRAATLIGADGKVQHPIAWEGDPPSGHHRRGVLSFAPPAARPTVVVLKISGVGGVDERTFEWTLKQ